MQISDARHGPPGEQIARDQVARKDPALYELLALIDAVRDGRVRARKLAEKELSTRLRRLLRD